MNVSFTVPLGTENIICPKCKGFGGKLESERETFYESKDVWKECPYCEGLGMVRQRVTHEIIKKKENKHESQ